MSLLKTYQKLLKDHFLIVQAVQTGILMGAGDIIAQTAVERRSLQEYEPVRTAKFAFLGVVFVGPVLTTWYKILAQQFGTKMSLSVTAKKVACDQLLFAPGFIAAIISSVNVLNGKNTSEIKNQLSKNYKDILITNWKVWPAVQLGPTLSVWYRVLARQFGTGMSATTTLKKVSCDQLIFAPTFLVAFITSINLLGGRNLEHVKKELSTSYTDILMANWKVWPAVQIVNFYLVPLNYQVLLVQAVALSWNTYLSWKTQKE